MRNKILVNKDYYMYLDDSDLSKIIINNGSFEEQETELIKSILRPTDIVVDIGAHIGYFTCLLGKTCSHGQVIAFEPEKKNYDILLKNIKLNKLYNVNAFNYAVGETQGDVVLYTSNINSGQHRIYQSVHCSGERQNVYMITIDKFLVNYPTPINFIKIDAEGSELGALKGMKNHLKNNDIKMIMEFHPPSIREYGADPKDVYDFMTVELGYNIDLIGYDNDDKISYNELVEKTSDPKGGSNLYCYK